MISPNDNRLDKLLSEPLDPEREAWDASTFRYMLDGRHIIKAPTANYRAIYNSFLTGTNVETIYSNDLAGTARNTFSVEGVQNDVLGMGPQPVIPPWFFLPGGQTKGRALRVVARGIYSSTATPTFTFTGRIGAIASITASIMGGTGAITAGSTQTNLLWEAEFDVQLTLPGTVSGANSTLRGLGQYTMGLTSTTIGGGQIFGGAASPGTVATFDMSITNYININANCSASSGSNIYQLLQLIVMGLN